MRFSGTFVQEINPRYRRALVATSALTILFFTARGVHGLYEAFDPNEVRVKARQGGLTHGQAEAARLEEQKLRERVQPPVSANTPTPTPPPTPGPPVEAPSTALGPRLRAQIAQVRERNFFELFDEWEKEPRAAIGPELSKIALDSQQLAQDRYIALLGMAYLGASLGAEGLEKLSVDPNFMVRRAVSLMLDDDPVTEAHRRLLSQLLADSDARVREVAAEVAIRHFKPGPRDEAMLKSVVRDPRNYEKGQPLPFVRVARRTLSQYSSEKIPLPVTLEH